MDDGSIAYRKFGENTDVKYSYTTGKGVIGIWKAALIIIVLLVIIQ